MIPYLNLEYWLARLLHFIRGLSFPFLPGWLPYVWFVLYGVLWAVILWMIYRIIKGRLADTRDLKAALVQEKSTPVLNGRWQKVLKRLESENPAEWKLAIIEADTMLDELVKALRPHEETLGERLKAIEPSDFDTLQDAWDAHKMRNRIAHEGEFNLSKHEALRTIGMFKRVFEEFQYI